MPRSEQQPQARDNGRDGTAYSHPAFGQIRAGRVSGSSTLYGSDFLHHHYITIYINRSELHRDLSRDWHFPREELIEVALSEAQWATFVSSLNVGGGVPCTIQHVDGKQAPGIPFRVQEDDFKTELNDTVRGMVERIDKTIREVEEGIGTSLSKKKRDELTAELHRLRSDVSSGLPFVAESFGEHMEQTVESAKVEVHGYVQNMVTRAGLAALSSGDTGHAPFQLSAPSEPAE
jgi:hypothetical protein